MFNMLAERMCSLFAGIPINGNFSQWSEWSQCTQSCNGGTQYRSRECDNPRPANGGNDCRKMGQATWYKRCNSQNCPGKVSMLEFKGKFTFLQLLGLYKNCHNCVTRGKVK